MTLDQLIQLALDRDVIDTYDDLPFIDFANNEIQDRSALINWLVNALGLHRCVVCQKVLRDATSASDECYECGLTEEDAW